MKTFLVKFRKSCSKYCTRLKKEKADPPVGSSIPSFRYSFSIHSPSYVYVRWILRRGVVHLHTTSAVWFNVSNLALQSSSEDKKEATD